MQPDASPRVIAALRALTDDIGRAFLSDEYGIDRSTVSRIVRAQRDTESVRPSLGFAEAVLQRARRDEDAHGRRSRAEELLSALAGEPVRFGLRDPPPPPSARPDVVGAAHGLRQVFAAAGRLAEELDAGLADGQLDEDEIRRGHEKVAALYDRLSVLLRALGGAA